MMRAGENFDDWQTRTAARAFVRVPRSAEFLGTPRYDSCDSSAAGKNRLWHLWARPAGVLRSQGALDTGPALWGHTALSGGGDPTSALPELWQGETREAGVAGRQSAVHQTLCLVRGPAVAGCPDPGGSTGTAAGLAYGQETGETVPAGTTAASRDSQPAGDWDR